MMSQLRAGARVPLRGLSAEQGGVMISARTRRDRAMPDLPLGWHTRG